MLRNNIIGTYLLVTIACLFIAACAQIVTPTGGARDTTPPELIDIKPASKTTNFNKNRISFRFSEFIQLNDPDNQVIISPPLAPKPEFINKGKVLEVRLKGGLEPNTTYTINFGNSIGDNKENNIVTGLSYVFSTGSLIDTNSIGGKIINAFNNTEEKDITVGLYEYTSYTDSTPFKNKPVYLGRTGNNGYFQLSNLPAKTYRLVAFKDENKNLKKDPQEEVAFHTGLINTVDSVNKNLNMQLFNPDQYKEGRIIDTFNRQPGKYIFIVYKSPVLIESTSGERIYTKQMKGVSGIDTFIVFTKPSQETQKTFHLFTNRSKQIIPVKNKNLFKTDPLSVQFNRQPELNDTIIFSFNNPVTYTDTSRIQLFSDSVRIYPQFIPGDFTLKLIYKWKEKTSYKIDIKDSAFQDLYGQFNKKDKNSFITKTAKDYATLLLHIRVPAKVNQYILQLSSADEKTTFYEFIITGNKDIALDYVLPGAYKVKYIYDSNKNGKWDNGDYFMARQPERIGYFKETINVKAYWDLEQSILIE